MTTSKKRFPVTLPITVFFSDCDPMGHCNNARYFTFMEQARVAYYKKLKALDLRTMGPRSTMAFIVAGASCTFHAPATVDQTLVVGVRIAEFRERSFTMEYEMREKKSRRLIVTGKSVQVMFNYKRQRSFPIPPTLRRQIERLEGGAPPSASGGR